MVIPKDPLECFANKEGLYYLELTWQYPALGEANGGSTDPWSINRKTNSNTDSNFSTREQV